MSGPQILRSGALQKALALGPGAGRRPPFMSTFASTLANVQSRPPAQTPSQTSAKSARPIAAAPVSLAVPGSSTVPYQSLIVAAAQKYGLDPALLAGIVKQESSFNPNAKSGSGAKGLTQLMDSTARGLGVTDPYDPAQSIDGGARFLCGLMRQFHGDQTLAVAAYNAGPVAVQKYGGIPPYEETRMYVPKVLGYAAQFSRSWANSATAPTTPQQN